MSFVQVMVNELTIVLYLFAALAIYVHQNTVETFKLPEEWSKNVEIYCGPSMMDPETANFAKFYNYFVWLGIVLGSWIE